MGTEEGSSHTNGAALARCHYALVPISLDTKVDPKTGMPAVPYVRLTQGQGQGQAAVVLSKGDVQRMFEVNATDKLDFISRQHVMVRA